MTNWQASNHESLLNLQYDATKISFWHSAAVHIPRNNSSATTQNMDKAPMSMPSYKCYHGITGQINYGSHNNFKGNERKGASGRKLNWRHLKDAKADLKSPSRSNYFDKKVKHEKTTSGSKSYDSWNKAKTKLTEDEFNKSRRANACISCGEVGHKFSNCPKPKP
jgi:hypothetical protein